MNEQIVSLKTAELAKEKELDFELDLGGNCTCYNKENELLSYHVHFQYPDRSEYVFAPTQGLLQKWLREVHKIHIGVDYDRHGWSYFLTNIKNDTGEVNWSKDYTTYEEAIEAGLYRALSEIDKQEDPE
jgi:hypothetical protein